MKRQEAKSKSTRLPPQELVPLKLIHDDGRNHRMENAFTKKYIAELADSIRVNGLKQAILVYDCAGTSAHKGKGYILGFGFCRVAACGLIGWTAIPAVVLPLPIRADGEIDNSAISIDRAVENIHRLNPNPMEESLAILQAVDETNGDTETLALRIGRPESWVRDRLYLQRLGAKCRKFLTDGVLYLSYAREIAKLADHALQDRVALDCIVREDGTIGISLERVKRYVADHERSLMLVPWQLDQDFPKNKGVVGKCSTCEFNSSNDKLLFEHDETNPPPALCLKASCFEAKTLLTQLAIDKAARSIVNKNLPATEKQAREQTEGVADFVKAPSVARAAKKMRDEEAAGAGGGGGGGGTREPVAPTPEHEAEQKLAAALEQWTIEANAKVKKAALAKPLRLIALFLLEEAGALPKFDISESDMEKVRPLIDVALHPNLINLAGLEEAALSALNRQPDPLLPILADLPSAALLRRFVDGWQHPPHTPTDARRFFTRQCGGQNVKDAAYIAHESAKTIEDLYAVLLVDANGHETIPSIGPADNNGPTLPLITSRLSNIKIVLATARAKTPAGYGIRVVRFSARVDITAAVTETLH